MLFTSTIRVASRRVASNSRRLLSSSATKTASSQDAARKLAPYFAAATVAFGATQLSVNKVRHLVVMIHNQELSLGKLWVITKRFY